MEQGLAEFLRERKARAADSDINWQAKKDNWVLSVGHLYEFIENLLKEAIEANDVTVKTFPLYITEQFVGQYFITGLELTIGYEQVKFLPKGVMVMGVAGRVDIVGDANSVTLVRDADEVDSTWSVIVQRVPFLTKVPLDQDSLRSAFEKVMLPLT